MVRESKGKKRKYNREYMRNWRKNHLKHYRKSHRYQFSLWRATHRKQARMASYRSSSHTFIKYTHSIEQLLDLMSRCKARIEELKKNRN